MEVQRHMWYKYLFIQIPSTLRLMQDWSPSPDQEFIWILGCITWACLLGTEKDSNYEVE